MANPEGEMQQFVTRQEYQELLKRLDDQAELNRDLLKATSLSEDPIIRKAQLSAKAWVSSKTGWWVGALSSIALNRELLGPAATHVWQNSYNPLTIPVVDILQRINPESIPTIQGTAPWALGFAVGGEIGYIMGRRIGTRMALKDPEKKFNQLPIDYYLPNWLVLALSPQRLVQKALMLVPSLRRSY